MATSRFLTHEQELLLSDALVARRKVRDRIAQENPSMKVDEIVPIDPEDIRVWIEGNSAATELVESYIPRCRALAHGVISRRRGDNRRGNSFLEMDELVNVGVEAMLRCTWAFDARGESREKENGRLGVRFGTYSTLAIQKAMNRLLAKMSTPVSLGVSRIESAWTWATARAELQNELGREPTIREIESRSGVNYNYVRESIPATKTSVDVDNIEIANFGSPIEQVLEAANTQLYNGILKDVLLHVMKPESVEFFLLLIGADNGMPRNAAEVGALFGMTPAKAAAREQAIYSLLRHPQYRATIRKYLREERPDILVDLLDD